MSAYPVLYEVDYVEPRNRLTVFFRVLLAIPHMIVLYLVAVALTFTVIAAWVAQGLTGRYPEGRYSFNAKALRWLARVHGYLYLQVDRFPPFDLGEHPEYPVRMVFAGPLAKYSRAKALFRIIIAIPVMVIAYAMGVVYQLCAIAAWFVVVVMGRLPKGIFDGIELGMAYAIKAAAYLMLLTETYPPFSNENATLEPVGAAGALGGGGFAPPRSSLPGGLEG